MISDKWKFWFESVWNLDRNGSLSAENDANQVPTRFWWSPNLSSGSPTWSYPCIPSDGLRWCFPERFLREFWVLWNKWNGKSLESVIRNVIFRWEAFVSSQLKLLTLNMRLTFEIWSVESMGGWLSLGSYHSVSDWWFAMLLWLAISPRVLGFME